jgi:hypothetical protein
VPSIFQQILAELGYGPILPPADLSGLDAIVGDLESFAGVQQTEQQIIERNPSQ